jgi:hypothetical protein
MNEKPMAHEETTIAVATVGVPRRPVPLIGLLPISIFVLCIFASTGRMKAVRWIVSSS